MTLIPRRTISYIADEFIGLLRNYDLSVFVLDDDQSFYILNDSLVLSIKYEKSKYRPIITEREINSTYRDNPYLEIPKNEESYCCLAIEELTYNEIGFKYTHLAFTRKMEKVLGID